MALMKENQIYKAFYFGSCRGDGDRLSIEDTIPILPTDIYCKDKQFVALHHTKCTYHLGSLSSCCQWINAPNDDIF